VFISMTLRGVYKEVHEGSRLGVQEARVLI
jgi:hypothetical protein